jgi:hypothetical protein
MHTHELSVTSQLIAESWSRPTSIHACSCDPAGSFPWCQYRSSCKSMRIYALLFLHQLLFPFCQWFHSATRASRCPDFPFILEDMYCSLFLWHSWEEMKSTQLLRLLDIQTFLFTLEAMYCPLFLSHCWVISHFLSHWDTRITLCIHTGTSELPFAFTWGT